MHTPNPRVRCVLHRFAVSIVVANALFLKDSHRITIVLGNYREAGRTGRSFNRQLSGSLKLHTRHPPGGLASPDLPLPSLRKAPPIIRKRPPTQSMSTQHMMK
uniref:Uncharacterized protein n=1 Tax=Amphora coffeiformis TaxID=265554 RepID=A0A7S3P405_9STRA|mmetsp:Transcript_11475/g.21868  ORF Transcript_11475/g.21868 Transcript_11475/m.21868 type:complete len:103 (-) Transcript_11475:89-397(-)|eukprot:scaffold3608_cov183-Amphora_coffeaeformis.AAC.3